MEDSFDDPNDISGFKGFGTNHLRDYVNHSILLDTHKEIYHELNDGLTRIKHHLKDRKRKYRDELKKRIMMIENDEKKLDLVSQKFKDRWQKIQKKTLFLSVLRRSLRNTRNFGIDPKKLPEVAQLDEEPPKKKCSVIYPDRWFYKLHIMIMLLIMVYLIIFFPLDLAFNLNESSSIWRTSDQLITYYFAIDIIVSFFTAFEENGILIDSNIQIAKNYLLKWFIIDLITVIPLDVLLAADNLRYKRLLKAPRLMRLINSMFQNTESKKKTRSMLIEKLKLIFSSSKSIYTFKYIILTAIFIHVNACLWYFIGDITGMSYSQGNWIDQ